MRPQKLTDFIIFDEIPDPTQESQMNNEVISTDQEAITLQNHIKGLHEQLIISNNDLIKLHEFINQPLLDKKPPGVITTETTYKTARQKIAIRYATNELKSIHDVVVYISTHISDVDLRLVRLKDSLEVLRSAKGNVFSRLSEMMLELWDLYAAVLELIGVCGFALEHEVVFV